MNINPADIYEARAILEAWVLYFNRNGTSAGLIRRTTEILNRLPEAPRYIPSPEEAERMARNGEA